MKMKENNKWNRFELMSMHFRNELHDIFSDKGALLIPDDFEKEI